MESFAASMRQQQRDILQHIDTRVEVACDAIAAQYLEAVVKQWPGTDRSIHVYATDRSKQSWQVSPRWTDSSGVWRRVYNTARDSRGRGYTEYTDRGYTVAGQHTARSWHVRRGETSYLWDTWQQSQQLLQRVAEARMRR